MPVTNRNSKINGLTHTGFESRTVGKFDGSNDFGKRNTIYNTTMIAIFGDGSSFGHTVYIKFKLNANTGANQFLFVAGNDNVSGSNVHSFQLLLQHVDASNFKLYLQCGLTTFIARSTNSTFLYSTYVGKIMTVVFRMSSSTAALTWYVNGNGYTTSNTGTLPHPSAFSASNTYRLNVGARQYLENTPVAFASISVLNLAVFKSSYDIVQCEQNMNLATVRYKFNDGTGTTVTSYGTVSNLNLTLDGTDGTFWDTLSDFVNAGFRTINGFRKCCRYDGVDDLSYANNLTRTNLTNIFGSIPYTIYSKFKLLSDTTDSPQLIASICRPTNAGNNRISIGILKSTTTFKLYFAIVDSTGTGVIRQTTQDFNFADYIGTVMEVVFNISATTGALTFYLNNSSYATSSTGTLINLSSFTSASDYIFSLGGRYLSGEADVHQYMINAILIDFFILNGSYNPTECLSNIAYSPLRFKFNEAKGSVLYNTGLTSEIQSLACINTAESSFFTVV